MTWWGVNLDGIALINLIMCIGFSVDFSAHICYHYMSEEDKRPEERISASLYALGLPIIQGAVSTILGVFGLAFAPSYLYVTFFKMVFLVIFLGAAHGLVLLPVLLSLFGPGSCRSSNSSSSRRSVASSPSTVSVHSTKKAGCYTLGFVTPDAGRRGGSHLAAAAGTAAVHPVDHFQRRLMASPNFRDFRQSEFEPDRFTFITRLSDEGGVVSTPVRLASGSGGRDGVSDPRLTPVPETDEQYDSIIAQLGQRRATAAAGRMDSPRSGLHKAVLAATDSPRLIHASPRLLGGGGSRLDSPRLSNNSSAAHGRIEATASTPRLDSPGLRTPQPTTVIAAPPGGRRTAAPFNMEHKKLCKSKSHKPRSSLATERQTVKEATAAKQPLRKYHSFPYHMFINDGGYSSDDSLTK